MPESVDPYESSMLMLAVRSGALDDHLDDLVRWVRLRKESLALDRLLELEVGQVIRISNTVRPKLLAGVPCKIVSFESGDKVKVELLQTASDKWRRGNIVTLSKSLVGPDVSE